MQLNRLATPLVLLVVAGLVIGLPAERSRDFDGTISLFREGWQDVMAPMMVDMIRGETESTPELLREVDEYILASAGVQTIVQMERLVEMVRTHGRQPESAILDAAAYKAIYNERLMVPVRERIDRFERGDIDFDGVTVRGSRAFIESLKRIRASDVEWLLPSHGPIFRKDDASLENTIERLRGYLSMADWGTCATSWPLMDAWEKELAEGKMPE